MSAPDRARGEWAIHYQQPWKDDAANPKLPMPWRVAFLAYGNHRANGHANFKKEEIAKVLGRFDKEGDFKPADRRTVYRAIQQAVQYGLLDEGSRALCLIVPSHRVVGGPGSEDEVCRRHPKPRSAARRTSLRVVS